jgi:hypothetical protein
MLPMRKRSLWLRTPLLLLALLQLSVPAAAALADGRIGEPSGPAHIESHSTGACVRIHPADCAFHRLLSAPLARASAAVLRIREGRGISWTPASTPRSASPSHLSLPDSRAPPTLS